MLDYGKKDRLSFLSSLVQKGWMRYDLKIAGAVDFAGKIRMVTAMVWGAALVFKQWGKMKQG